MDHFATMGRSMYTLYYAAGACSLAPHIALREAGLPFDMKKVSTRYTLQALLNFIATELHKSFSPLFNPNLADDAKAVFRTRLLDRFKWVDGKLSGRDWLMGDRFGVADTYLFAVSNWAKPMAVDFTGLDSLLAYRKRVAERPAVQAALQAEGLSR
jgi:glutathione S-transferase